MSLVEERDKKEDVEKRDYEEEYRLFFEEGEMPKSTEYEEQGFFTQFSLCSHQPVTYVAQTNG